MRTYKAIKIQPGVQKIVATGDGVLMHSLKEFVVGILLIAALVGIATWQANDPERPPWLQSSFLADGEDGTAQSQIVVRRIAWSSDGRKLLSQSRGHSNNSELLLTLHDTEKRIRMPIDALGKKVSKAALAPDGLHVLVGTCQGELLWIDLESRETVALEKLPYPRLVSATAISSDGQLIVEATDAGQIYLGDTLRRPFIELAPSGQSGVTDVCLSRDGKRLVSARRDGLIAVWDLTTAKLLREFAGHRLAATAARFLSDGSRIISAGLDDTVRIWDIASGREEWRGEFGLLGVNTVDVSSDGVTAAWGGANHKIVVWDLERGEKKFEIVTPASTTFHLAFSPDGNTLAVAGSERTIRMFDARTGVEQKGLEVGRPLNEREDAR